MPQDHTLFVILAPRDERDLDREGRVPAQPRRDGDDRHPPRLPRSTDRSWPPTGACSSGYAPDETALEGAAARGERLVAASGLASRAVVRVERTWTVSGPAAGEARVELSNGRQWTSSQSGREGAADLEVAVIGAGPHGLAADDPSAPRGRADAACSARRWRFWKAMPEGMMLRSNLSRDEHDRAHRAAVAEQLRGGDGHRRSTQPVPLERLHRVRHRGCQQMAVAGRRRSARSRRSTAHRGAFAWTSHDGDALSARRVVVACGIAPFEHIPGGLRAPTRRPRLAHCPPPRPERLRRPPRGGRGRRSERLRVRGADARGGCRRRSRCWSATNAVVWLRGHGVKKVLGRLGPIVYAPTDVGPLWYSRLVAKPDSASVACRAVTQDRIAARSIRPACSHFVRVRLGDVAHHAPASRCSVRERRRRRAAGRALGRERRARSIT